MNKKKIAFSLIALLSFCISACGNNQPNESSQESTMTPSSEVTPSSTTPKPSSSSAIPSSSSSNSSSYSKRSSSSVEPIIVPGDNFTISAPTDLSMM